MKLPVDVERFTLTAPMADEGFHVVAGGIIVQAVDLASQQEQSTPCLKLLATVTKQKQK